MKTNREIKRDEVAAFAFRLYVKAPEDGLTNQQAIDVARTHKKVRVCYRTKRNYIELMKQHNQELMDNV